MPTSPAPPIASILVFTTCFVFWVLLSGHFGALELGLGVLASAAVTYLNRDLAALGELLRHTRAFVAYLPWLFREIVVANIQVVKVVLDPRLPIDPVVGRFQTALQSDLAITTLGNSITLTPGTITLDVDGREFVIHSLLGAEPIAACAGPMARRVGRVFGEDPQT
ncbi:MAG: Na+/H+ antiporter subunit E [Candidatus Rokubacteria bacterium]|nr:Na+/H+ antiporter subunit E [Candidatus Rokubacteria bacterium]